MNTHPLIGRLLALLLCAWAGIGRAESAVAPEETKLRGAIGRSLDFLAKEGDAWMNERDCNACHHMPELIWSHQDAKRRGFAIDQKKLDEFIEWSDARTKNVKGSLEMVAFLKLALPERPAPELNKLILEGQQADGSWKPGGQFASMQRRDTTEAAGSSAHLLLLALATPETDKPAADEARAKAEAWLAKSDPPKSVETLVFRTLYTRRFGRADEAEALRAEVLKLQQPDGGWAWMIGEAQSDALATGEVLYLLQQAPDASCTDSIARAQAWLLGTQRDDGSWSIDITRISRIDRSAPEKSKSLKDATAIYAFWGSAWATIGLLQGIPLSNP